LLLIRIFDNQMGIIYDIFHKFLPNCLGNKITYKATTIISIIFRFLLFLEPFHSLSMRLSIKFYDNEIHFYGRFSFHYRLTFPFFPSINKFLKTFYQIIFVFGKMILCWLQNLKIRVYGKACIPCIIFIRYSHFIKII